MVRSASLLQTGKLLCKVCHKVPALHGYRFEGARVQIDDNIVIVVTVSRAAVLSHHVWRKHAVHYTAVAVGTLGVVRGIFPGRRCVLDAAVTSHRVVLKLHWVNGRHILVVLCVLSLYLLVADTNRTYPPPSHYSHPVYIQTCPNALPQRTIAPSVQAGTVGPLLQ